MVRGAAFMGRMGRLNKVRIPPLAQSFLDTIYRIESRRFALWLPVGLGLGVWAYFRPADEPDWRWALAGVVPLILVATGRARRLGWGGQVFAWLGLVVALGYGAAAASAWRAAAPVIGHPIGETVEGRVIGLSRAASGAPRLLLDRVVIYGIEPEATPARVRLTMLGAAPVLPAPGVRVRVYATLMPTGEPVEPGGFDFRRRAYFDRLGGVGLTRGRLLALPDREEAGLWDRLVIGLAKARDRISRHLRQVLPGRQGGFAAAIIVGDRSDIAEEDAEALRAANLAHLLAISGLHMGLLTGLAYALARLAFALVPFTAYHLSGKKAAAVVALAAGAGYLALSGATVATQRAFIMVAFAFLAVLADRPAITLRALALAATVILLARPISLLDAGFQMSFAATVALVAGYEALRDRRLTGAAGRSGLQAAPRLLALYLGGLALSSLLAGLATAPFAAFHFNRTAPWGLVSNLAALPVMGGWIAPWAGIAALLAPFGLEAPALRAMGLGIELVLGIAHWVAGFPAAVRPVPAAPQAVLALIALGGLWLALWRGPWRFTGVPALLAGLAIWADAPPRPDVLIAPGARLVGVLGPEGRVLDRPRGQGFAAKTWLRRDGDLADQPTAASRPGLSRVRGRVSATLAQGWRLDVIIGRHPSVALIARLCRARTLLVVRHGPAHRGRCRYLGRADLRRAGALAVTIRAGRAHLVQARSTGPGRPWTRPALNSADRAGYRAGSGRARAGARPAAPSADGSRRARRSGN